MIQDIFAVAAEADDELRLKIVAKTVQKYLNLPGVIITKKSDIAQAHELIYATGYTEGVLEHVCHEYVVEDEHYRQMKVLERTVGLVSWASYPEFLSSRSARHWLLPAGYREGTSIPLRDSEEHEIGSLHINTFRPYFTARQLSTIAQFKTFVANQIKPIGIAPHGPLERLSVRELETLKLVATGMTNKQIADELYLAKSTVMSHLEQLFNKLQVSSRVEAAVLAVRYGLS